MRQNRSMVGDSLIYFAHDYYKGKDIVREMRSGMALGWYKFWVVDTPGAIGMLDSLIGLKNVPDSLMAQTLRIRALLGASEYQGDELVPLAKRLIDVEADTLRKMEAMYILVSTYAYSNKCDSALMLIDQLIGYANAHRWGDKQFQLEVERAQILTEAGRTRESNKAIAEIFRKSSPDNGAADYLHLQLALNALNTGDFYRASRELDIADSLALRLRGADNVYYRSYSNLMRVIIDFNRTGRMRLAHVNSINNRQQERFNRMQASQWEAERGALQQQSHALALKADNEHKTVVILLMSLVTVLISAGAAWMIKYRRQRERENEERVETLQKMVDELRAAPAPTTPETGDPEALRRAMLQQLGIIKMVAETPTEQNREMLRKISSIGGETNGALVNWSSVYELINTLYTGFHEKLHGTYAHALTDKEEQIIVLMLAGFSTKEISVITGQTTSTIYVRKSAVRKKLGVPGKDNIVAFLRNAFSR